MNTKPRKDWNTGLHIDGVANVVLLAAGIVVVLLAAASAGLESAMQERSAYQDQAGARPDTTTPA